MGGSSQQKSALGVARARFIEALPRKSKELASAINSLGSSPEAGRSREELRRRLHALYASAQVFREEALASAVRSAIDRLDRARDTAASLAPDDIESLKNFALSLPALSSSQLGKPSVISISPPPRSYPPDSIEVIVEPEPKRLDIRKEPPAIPPLPPFARTGRAKPGGIGRPIIPIDGAAEPRFLLDHQNLISVLVLDDMSTTAQIKDTLSAERFEVLATDNPEEALRLARSSSPDLVLADSQIVLRAEIDFISRLRGDPLTDLVPVFALIPAGKPYDPAKMREVGVDQVVFKPVDGRALLRAVGVMLGGASKTESALDGFSEGTVDEIVEKLTQELRFGLSESIQAGKDLKIPVGEGHEILAAAWSAIGRIRAHLSHQSGGAIKFRDGPRRDGPSVLALVDGGESEVGDVSVDAKLVGRHFLVIDDDPGVRWFFAGLLREAGAIVEEARDGQEGLEAARHSRPDVVISDILMPRIDGFALCREFKRDVVLADVPVILISWKEDLLTRMRELQAGASGYLRKEAGAVQILRRVHRVLRPVARLEAQLRTGTEVRGSLEGLGVLTLLKTVGRERPNARVTVRDARSLFEIDLREGQLVALTKTATDGSFVRGQAALEQLLATRSGRFIIVNSDLPARSIFRDSLAPLLRKSANQIAALVDAISDTNLVRVNKIIFNEEILPSIFSNGPRPAHETRIVERLRRGESPTNLIVEGQVAPRELESCLEDLARRGAISGVVGPNDEDRVAEALRVREERPGTLCTSTGTASGFVNVTVPSKTSEQDDDPWKDLAQESTAGSIRIKDPIKDSSSGGSVAEALRSIQKRGAAVSARPFEFGANPETREPKTAANKTQKQSAEYIELRFDSEPNIEPTAHSTAIGQMIDAAIGAEVVDASSELLSPLSTEPPAPTATGSAVDGPIGLASSSEKDASQSVRDDFTVGLDEPLNLDVVEEVPEKPKVKIGMIEQALREELARVSQSVEVSGLLKSSNPSPSAEKSEPEPSLPGANRRRNNAVRWLLISVAAIASIASLYVVFANIRQTTTKQVKTQTVQRPTPATPVVQKDTATFAETIKPELSNKTSVKPPTEIKNGVPRDAKTAEKEMAKNPEERSLPFIDRSWGVEVLPDDGLLVVEWNRTGTPPEVKVGDRKIGRPPFAVALSPARYELKFYYDGRRSTRRLSIRRGVTRIVYPPE
jgi:DNA-binding response OmpR family regulator